MKLEEFVTKLCDEKAELNQKNEESTIDYLKGIDPILNSKELEEVKDELLKLDVFSECDDLEIVHIPAFVLEDGKAVLAQSFKYEEGMKIKGKCYLYSISLTPVMYDPNQLIKPVKNGAAMGPTIYDPMTFEPRKHILLTWTPEMAQDLFEGTNNEETLRNDIHKLLDDVLDNPEEYRTKGTRHVLIRGVFETVENKRREPNFLVGAELKSL